MTTTASTSNPNMTSLLAERLYHALDDVMVSAVASSSFCCQSERCGGKYKLRIGRREGGVGDEREGEDNIGGDDGRGVRMRRRRIYVDLEDRAVVSAGTASAHDDNMMGGRRQGVRRSKRRRRRRSRL